MIGKDIDSIVAPRYVKPQGREGIVPTLCPQGHLWAWERRQLFYNRWELVGTRPSPGSWEDFFEDIFEWYHRDKKASRSNHFSLR